MGKEHITHKNSRKKERKSHWGALLSMLVTINSFHSGQPASALSLLFPHFSNGQHGNEANFGAAIRLRAGTQEKDEAEELGDGKGLFKRRLRLLPLVPLSLLWGKGWWFCISGGGGGGGGETGGRRVVGGNEGGRVETSSCCWSWSALPSLLLALLSLFVLLLLLLLLLLFPFSSTSSSFSSSPSVAKGKDKAAELRCWEGFKGERATAAACTVPAAGKKDDYCLAHAGREEGRDGARLRTKPPDLDFRIARGHVPRRHQPSA